MTDATISELAGVCQEVIRLLNEHRLNETQCAAVASAIFGSAVKCLTEDKRQAFLEDHYAVLRKVLLK